MLPDCSSGSCLISFDQLDGDDYRILEVHWLASNLSEIGLSRLVAAEYNLDRDDLIQLAVIESEHRKIAHEKQNQEDTSGEGC